LRRRLQGKTEGGSLPHFTLDPDPAAMHLDDSLDDGEADACPLAPGLQFIEEAKYLIVIFRRNADTIVPDKENGFFIFAAQLADLDQRRRLTAHEFGGIIEQVLQHFAETLTISINGRQIGLRVNRHMVGLQTAMYGLKCVVYQLIK